MKASANVDGFWIVTIMGMRNRQKAEESGTGVQAARGSVATIGGGVLHAVNGCLAHETSGLRNVVAA